MQEIPAVGAIFTNQPFEDIQEVKDALSFSERSIKSFGDEHLRSLSCIKQCIPATTEAQKKCITLAVE